MNAKDFNTNETAASMDDMQCACEQMWGIGQDIAFSKLLKPTKNQQWELIDDYNIRARRIAATYARIYLELEDWSDPEKIGRFYWMALGAFASKTVACTLETLQIKLAPNASDILAMGNFWLFMDVVPIHWYWATDPDSFDQCAPKRNNVTGYPKQVHAQLMQLPWYDKARQAIKDFEVSPEIEKAYALIKKCELAELSQKPDTQLQLLNAVVEHEQKNILQPLIYEHPWFSQLIKIQRLSLIKMISPEFEIIFTHACSLEDEELKSVAPEDTKLEDYDSRLDWMKQAIGKFHKLMQSRNELMLQELTHIASWISMQ
jgi:hypothetical protein